MADKRDYYEVLGTDRSATDDELKASYRNISLAQTIPMSPEARQVTPG